MPYTYSMLQGDIDLLNSAYNFVKVYQIGKSVQKRALHSIVIGKGSQHIFYNGAHHGMEYLTSALLMRFLKSYCRALDNGKAINGKDIYTLYNETTLHIVPMVNPDGVYLQQSGKEKYAHWQANANGVDLNHNYDAGFEIGKMFEQEQRIEPGRSGYSGSFPESEPESHAVAEYTRRNNFSHVIAWHSQGEVIYWKYQNIVPRHTAEMLEYFCQKSGYLPEEAEGYTSYGGYKDWFIEAYDKPGFTVEIGLGENPLPDSQLDTIYQKTLDILLPYVIK